MSQTEMILSALKKGDSLTHLDALNLFGCLRLAARVSDLRNAGHVIDTETVKVNGKAFALYRMRK